MQLQRTAGNNAARQLIAAKSSSMPIQRLTEEDIESRSDKTKLKKLRDLFGNKLGVMSALYHFNDLTFDDLFEAASSLDDLEKRINTIAAKADTAKTAKLASEAAAAAAPPPAPKAKEESKEMAVPAPKKEKKKKEPKENLAALLFTGGTKTVQQAVDVQAIATNPILNAWIASKPPSATIIERRIEVSVETVYIYATVRIPDNSVPGVPQVNVYNIEIHYHPVPTSANYLHVKRSAGSDAGNIIAPTSWLIPRGKDALRDAVAQWNDAYPDRPSPHAW